jgi:hypothetical protein
MAKVAPITHLWLSQYQLATLVYLAKHGRQTIKGWNGKGISQMADRSLLDCVYELDPKSRGLRVKQFEISQYGILELQNHLEAYRQMSKRTLVDQTVVQYHLLGRKSHKFLAVIFSDEPDDMDEYLNIKYNLLRLLAVENGYELEDDMPPEIFDATFAGELLKEWGI